MVKRRKLIALCLSAVMAASILSGCSGGKDEPKTDDNTNANAEATGESENNEEQGSTLKTYDDLGGMKITIGDWYSAEEEDLSTTYAEDTYNYRQEIFDQYNFTIERQKIGTWGDMAETFTTDCMAGNPRVDIWYLYQTTVAQPLKNNLFYDLGSLETVDFSAEKWNQHVKELMTYNGGIYGMSTEKEPRAAIFYNKRMFEEAGIDPEEPYELQKNGEWTWDKFEEYCAKLTKDVDNDGKTDIYAMMSFSKDFFKLAIASNGAQFVSKNAEGKYENATKSQNFIDAANWAVGLIDQGYVMRTPTDEVSDADATWTEVRFRDGECAMQVAEVYQVGDFAGSMDDEFGLVMFPAGPNGNMATVPIDNVIVIPSCYTDKEYVEKLMFAYNLYTEPAPGYSLDEVWKNTYYPQFSDTKAVDETLTMMRDEKYRVYDYQPMIIDTDYGDFAYAVEAGAKTPAEQLEEMTPTWDARIKEANGE